MKVNDETCHFPVFGDKNKEITIKTGNPDIKDSDYEILLGITLDKKLNLKKDIENLCRKANQTTNALARLSNSIDHVKLDTLVNPFISSKLLPTSIDV